MSGSSLGGRRRRRIVNFIADKPFFYAIRDVNKDMLFFGSLRIL